MIGTVMDRLFGCAHRRITRPITPVTKPGEPHGDTYIVCLDCGKQFAYDWEHMRVGKAIVRSKDAGVLHPDMPGPPNTKVKYALLGSAVPLGFLLFNALRKRPAEKKEPGNEPE